MDDPGVRHRHRGRTIRIWTGTFVGFGLLEFDESFGPSFWISFSLHAGAAELWLPGRPNPPD